MNPSQSGGTFPGGPTNDDLGRLLHVDHERGRADFERGSVWLRTELPSQSQVPALSIFSPSSDDDADLLDRSVCAGHGAWRALVVAGEEERARALGAIAHRPLSAVDAADATVVETPGLGGPPPCDVDALAAALAGRLLSTRADAAAYGAGPADASTQPIPVATPSSAPLSSWVAVAGAVGVDESTVRAHRRRTRDAHGRFFADAEAAREWYAALVRAPDFAPPTRPPRNHKKTQKGQAVDWSKVKG